jgi:phosphopantothenoylcysteine synthetase/decarboxylase
MPGCDLVIANDVSQPGIGFDSVENAVTLCFASGVVRSLPKQPKDALAATLLREISTLAASRAGAPNAFEPSP